MARSLLLPAFLLGLPAMALAQSVLPALPAADAHAPASLNSLLPGAQAATPPAASAPVQAPLAEPFSFGDVPYSLMYSPQQLKSMKDTLSTYEALRRAHGDVQIEVIEEVAAPKPVINEPANYPVFTLNSIAYRNGSDWSVWVNGVRLTPRGEIARKKPLTPPAAAPLPVKQPADEMVDATMAETAAPAKPNPGHAQAMTSAAPSAIAVPDSNSEVADVHVIAISSGIAQFSWKPSYISLVKSRLDTHMLADTAPVKHKQTATNTAHYNPETGEVFFTLRPNQSFAAGYMATFEGKVSAPALAPFPTVLPVDPAAGAEGATNGDATPAVTGLGAQSIRTLYDNASAAQNAQPLDNVVQPVFNDALKNPKPLPSDASAAPSH